MSVSASILWFSAKRSGPDAFLPAHVRLLANTDQRDLKRRNHIIELYDSLRPSLFAYLSCLGLSSEEAEDIIQESFLRLIKHVLAERSENNLRGWLFRVAHNLTMDLFRSGARQVEPVEDFAFSIPDRADASPSPEEIVIKKEELARLELAMARLTAQQRYAVLLRAEGLRYREIAAVLGVSLQRVADLVQRALTRLAGDL